MTNNTFSIKRFKQQFLLDFNKELAQALLLIGLSLGLNILYVSHRIVFMDKPGIIKNEITLVFVLSYMLCSLFFTGSLFSFLRNKNEAISYLTAPTSAIEKYFSNLLLVLIYNASFLLLYKLVFEFGIIYLIEEFNDEIFIVHTDLEFHKVILWYATIHALLHPFFLFGSVSFKKLPAVKTAICLAVFITLLMGLNELYYTKRSWLSLPIRRFFEYQFSGIFLIGSVAVSFLFLLLTFLRLKEKEV